MGALALALRKRSRGESSGASVLRPQCVRNRGVTCGGRQKRGERHLFDIGSPAPQQSSAPLHLNNLPLCTTSAASSFCCSALFMGTPRAPSLRRFVSTRNAYKARSKSCPTSAETLKVVSLASVFRKPIWLHGSMSQG